MPTHSCDNEDNAQNYTIPAVASDESRFSTRYLEKLATQVRDELFKYNIGPTQEQSSPDDFDTNPLAGHCYVSARELSFSLHKANIPHRVVKGGIKPLLEQVSELQPPYTIDNIEAIGARHWWVEVDHPTTSTTWSMELCSEHRGEHFQTVLVDTTRHEDLVTVADGMDMHPETLDDPDWNWNPNNPSNNND